MGKLQVACFGEVLWDIYERGERGDLAIAREFRRELGGAVANVAAGLARLGVRASLVGGVGQDLFGEALAQSLAAEGIETRHLVHLPNRTGLTFITRDPKGQPRFLFYRHESADVSLREEHITPAMGHARWALVGTSTLMTPALAGATTRFLDVAQEAGAHVAVDLNVRPRLWKSRARMVRETARLVARASLVKASAEDLEALAGDRGLAWLRARAKGAALLITRGAGDATAFGEYGEVHAPARRVVCVDATGAGDAFIAASLATLLAAGATPGSRAFRDPDVWAEVLRAGHALGAKAVSRVGAVTGLTGLAPLRARLERIAQRRS